MDDLAIIVADKNMEFALKGGLDRPEALGIRPIIYKIEVHPGHDGGVRKSGPEILARLRRQYSHGLIMFDFDGCGRENQSPAEVEQRLNARLVGLWGEDARTIVIQPELDVWIWGSDNAISDPIGWSGPGSIRGWLTTKGFEFEADHKPKDPKKALETVLEHLRQARSSALYRKITGRISLSRCTDPAFLRLKSTLVDWFPPA